MSVSSWKIHSTCVRCFLNLPQGVCEIQMELPNLSQEVNQNDKVWKGLGKRRRGGWVVYSLIAFDERVTFWLQCIRSLPCACAYVALFASRLAYNHWCKCTLIQCSKHTRTRHCQGSDPVRWSQKVTLLSKAMGVHCTLIWEGIFL